MATVIAFTSEDKLLHVQCNIEAANVTTHQRRIAKKLYTEDVLFTTLHDDITPSEFSARYDIISRELVSKAAKVKRKADKIKLAEIFAALQLEDVDEFILQHSSKEILELIIRDRIAK